MQGMARIIREYAPLPIAKQADSVAIASVPKAKKFTTHFMVMMSLDFLFLRCATSATRECATVAKTGLKTRIIRCGRTEILKNLSLG
jgi:hypothetical protein